ILVTPNSSLCNWTANSGTPWITITGGSAGTGTGTVTYTIDPNPTAAQRTGTFTIAGTVFTVTQAGATCTYTFINQPIVTNPLGGGGQFNTTVVTQTGCHWTASSTVPWINSINPTSDGGINQAALTYKVDANLTGGTLTGILRFAGANGNIDFTLTQVS